MLRSSSGSLLLTGLRVRRPRRARAAACSAHRLRPARPGTGARSCPSARRADRSAARCSPRPGGRGAPRRSRRRRPRRSAARGCEQRCARSAPIDDVGEFVEDLRATLEHRIAGAPAPRRGTVARARDASSMNVSSAASDARMPVAPTRLALVCLVRHQPRPARSPGRRRPESSPHGR